MKSFMRPIRRLLEHVDWTFWSQEKKDQTQEKIRIKGTFDSKSERVYTILKKHLGILKLDPKIAECIPAHLSVTYRRGRSIGDCLVHSHYSRPVAESTWLGRETDKMTGMYRCGLCSFCPFINRTKVFSSSVTNISN